MFVIFFQKRLFTALRQKVSYFENNHHNTVK